MLSQLPTLNFKSLSLSACTGFAKLYVCGEKIDHKK